MKNKKNIEGIYPIKKAKNMADDEFARWWALMEGLKVIFDHADKYNIDMDSVNINSKRILDEYVTPISGDILNDIQEARKGTKEFTRTIITTS